MKKEIGMYALTISTYEAYEDLKNDGGKLNAITGTTKAVYQDPNGHYQMLLYETPKDRNDAYRKGKDEGLETLAFVPQMIYVDAKYLR